MKNNNGISLIALIIMIVIILILATIFISSGETSLNESRKAQIANEIALLKQAVTSRYVSYEKNDGNIILYGTLAKSTYPTADECITKIEEDLAELTESEKEKLEATFQRDYEKYVMIIRSNDKKKLGMENYLDYTVYIADYYEGTVYGPIDL